MYTGNCIHMSHSVCLAFSLWPSFSVIPFAMLNSKSDNQNLFNDNKHSITDKSKFFLSTRIYWISGQKQFTVPIVSLLIHELKCSRSWVNRTMKFECWSNCIYFFFQIKGECSIMPYIRVFFMCHRIFKKWGKYVAFLICINQFLRF